MNDEDSIRELQRNWFAATHAGDSGAISDLMTSDAEFLVPGRPPFGRQEFLSVFQSMKDAVTLACAGEYQEIHVAGDVAHATARLEVSVTPADGGAPRQLSGFALSVFRRSADGKWRLFRDASLLVPNGAPPSNPPSGRS